MNTARNSRIETDADVGGAPRRAVVPIRQQTRQEALLSAADRIKRTLGEATAQLERLEGRFDNSAPGLAAATLVGKPQPVSRMTAGAVASAEARVRTALRGVLVALRDMGLPRGGASAR